MTSRKSNGETTGDRREVKFKGQQDIGNGDTKLVGSTGSEHRTLMVVFLSLVIDLLAFTLILPLLPSLLDYYGSQEHVSIL